MPLRTQWAALALALLAADRRTGAARVRVNPATHAFEAGVGASTRELYFHGVNYVRKGAPYIADTLDCAAGVGAADACPPGQTWTLSTADAEQLRDRGMNLVRLEVGNNLGQLRN